ncbi:hypothetical protein ACSZM9_09725 [Aeromonas hydrophila]|uniref:hypothetical protein n=1 Tax=Aeromonas hydrophila TaxID=644 RepID=UPI003EC93DAC
MDVKHEIKYASELAILAANLSEQIYVEENKSFDSVKSAKKYTQSVEKKRVLTSSIVNSIGVVEDKLDSDEISWKIPSGYNLFLINYSRLIQNVCCVIIGAPDIPVERLSICNELVDLMDDVSSLILSFEKDTALIFEITDKLARRLVQATVDFNYEVIAFPIRKANNEGLARIDAEIDEVKSSLDEKLVDITQQYSDSRAKLIESVKEYESSIKDLHEEGSNYLTQFEQSINKVNLELDGKETEIEHVMVAARNCLEIANGMLQRTSQVGMAAAFQERHKSLKTSMIIWFVAFFVCLCGLTFVGVVFVMSAFSSEIKTAVELVSKIAITFPLVWGAWFSAKQYSHVSQLREDYAYKVAVAMTYHGYKGEAADVNKEMSGKLLDSIISQFSDNPVRLYQNNNSASVIEAMLKNDKFSDIINSAKNGVSGSAK